MSDWLGGVMGSVRHFPRVVTCLTLVLAVAASGGCERWPWEPKAELGRSTSGSPAAAPPGSQPGVTAVAPQERVATVNGVPLSTADVGLAVTELKQLYQSFQQPWETLSAQDLGPDKLDLHDMMDSVVDAELKAQDARARGLDQRTEVKQRVTYLLRNLSSQEWDRWQLERVAPMEEAITQFYEQNKAAFVEPERIHVRQAVTETLAAAEALRARAVGGEVFASLARELSVGAGKENGGDIGWSLRVADKDRLTLIGQTPSEGTFFPQLEPVAFALEVAQVSQPVKGPDGRFYVVQLEERKASKQQTELEVHDAIKGWLTRQNLEQQIEALRQKATVERFPERLEGVTQ